MRRANPPDAGLWGFPGGRIEPGEDLLTAAGREFHEETGLLARAGDILTAFDSIHRDGEGEGELMFHYVIVAVLCHLSSADPALRPMAADDALEADWFELEAMDALGARASSGVARLAHLAEERL